MNCRNANWIGIYVKAAGPDLIGPLTITFFSRLILDALEREGVLVALTDLPKITTSVSLSEILATVVVSDLPRSLHLISDELDQAGILENSQVAWRDFDEQIWRDQRPQNPVVTFEQRMAESTTWASQALSLLRILKLQRSALLMLQEGMPKPQGNT